MMVLALFVMTGCRPGGAKREQRELDSPAMKAAQTHMRSYKYADAVRSYNEALLENPGLARAHFELGVVYDEYFTNKYLSAIYHFEQYLNLRPNTEKRELIQDAIRHARLSYVASLPKRPSEVYDEVAKLQRKEKKTCGELG